MRQHLNLIKRMITPQMFAKPLNMHGFMNGFTNHTMWNNNKQINKQANIHCM